MLGFCWVLNLRGSIFQGSCRSSRAKLELNNSVLRVPKSNDVEGQNEDQMKRKFYLRLEVVVCVVGSDYKLNKKKIASHT